jgi:hypothetical protein
MYFPRSNKLPNHLTSVVRVFTIHEDNIKSPENKLSSNEVLLMITEDLEIEGYSVEKGKKKKDKLHVPVLFGLNGQLERSFEADAYNQEQKTVIEVEAGRAVDNYQFLKDLFQACVMHNVDYLVIAVRNTYRSQYDFKTVVSFLEVFFASGRMQFPLKGILIVGY